MRHYNEFSSFGAYLRHVRTHNNLGQREVGAVLMPRFKHAAKVISKIENGLQRASIGQLPLFAKALSWPEDTLREAFGFFNNGRSLLAIPLDNKEDLRPLLKSLAEGENPITGDSLVEAIKHYVALKRLGVKSL